MECIRAPQGHLLLLTGAPGIGKTTLIRKIAERLGDRRLNGFYTQEIRNLGQRLGFRLVTFSGEEGVIAHVRFRGIHRVGKYGVDVATIDRMVETALSPEERTDVYLVDEIGKMECLSERFVAAMRHLLEYQKPLVATLSKKGSGFIQDVKRRKDALLWEVTHQNRDALPNDVVAWLGEL
jgi:nucleoside-triphosphatase